MKTDNPNLTKIQNYIETCNLLQRLQRFERPQQETGPGTRNR